MRLVAFRSRNFRSIQDSGRCEMSAEDICVLVGQNEAGKSSLLEALMAFQTGTVGDNDLRSDGTLPSVTCEYDLSAEEVRTWFAVAEEKIGVSLAPTHSWRPARVKVTSEWISSEKESSSYSVDFDYLLPTLAQLLALMISQNPMTLSANAEFAAELMTSEAEDRRSKIVAQIETSCLIQLTEEVNAGLLDQLPTFVLFNEENCLLPSTIDIVASELDEGPGKAGAGNFLTVAGLDIKVLLNTPPRHRESMLASANQKVTDDFQRFWTQQVGKTQKVALQCDLRNYPESAAEEKRGTPYLVFYISEANDKLYPSQRSKGVRWFISFFLQLWASAKTHKSTVFLLDEPGANLHSKAQQDVLNVIERSCSANQVIYSTHSPDLVRAENLGRVLAVQRSDVDDNASPTTVITAHRLSSASVDTMSVIYRAMGADFSRQQVIEKSNNVLLEELSALYYLKAFCHLLTIEHSINFLPATGVTNIPTIANLLMGWGIEFIILLDDDKSGRGVAKTMLKELFFGDEAVGQLRMLRIPDCQGVEDLFTPQDFCTHVLLKPGLLLDRSCSQSAKAESKGMLAYGFWCKVQKGDIQLSDLAPDTIFAASALLNRVVGMLKDYPR